MKVIPFKHSIAPAWLTAACLLAVSSSVAASPAGLSADELLESATGVLKEIDAGHYTAVWNSAALFVKADIPRDEFVTTIRRARVSLGAIDHRGWSSVVRIQYEHATHIPNGLYANVDFSTMLGDGRIIYELLSFKLESDGLWHLTGYVPRPSQDSGSSGSPVVKP
jgi:hypothetical protein